MDHMHPATKHGVMQMRITFAVLCLAILLHATEPATRQLAASGVATDFCELDAEGKRLNAAGAKDLAKGLVLAQTRWEQPFEVVVIRDYFLRASGLQKDSSAFVADYHVLGRIDSSLSLTRLQMPYSTSLPVQSEQLSLILTDTHTEIGTDGRQQQVKGPLEWRIKSYPSQPHVGINAAIAYIRMMGYRAKDARMKMNSEKTLSELQQMLVPSSAPQLAEPKAIVSQFIDLQMGGVGIQPESAGQMGAFLVHPDSQQKDKIGVATAYAVKKTTFLGNKATVSVEYEAMGEIDSRLRFTSLGVTRTLVQRDLTLLLDNKYSVTPEGGGKPRTELAGPSRWRIEEAPPEQWLSVAAAIKYVTQMRNAVREPSINENADKTLAILKGLR